MSIPDLWRTTDIKMLQIVVELQVCCNGTFLLEELMDKVGLLDRGDSFTGLTPWMVTEILRRLSEAGFIIFAKESEDPRTEEEELYITDWEIRGSAGAADMEKWIRTKKRHVDETFFNGVQRRGSEASGKPSVLAYWRSGKFFINGVQQLYSVRATPDGLRRVGAWPNPERFTEELAAILSNLAESIEAKRPEDATTLRQIGRVMKTNAIELSAAVLAKLLEHAAGL